MMPTETHSTVRRASCCHSGGKWWRLLAAGLVLVLAGCAAFGPEKDEYEEASIEQKRGDRLEGVRQKVATSVRKLANSLDNFFGANRIYEEVYGNYVQLNLQTLYQDSGAISYNSTVQANLVFPHTEKRWKLLVQTDADRKFEGDNFVDDPLSAVTDTNYIVGLRYVGKRTRKWDATFDSGVLFVAPIDLFVRGRLRRQYRFEKWSPRLAETLTAYTSQRQIATTEMDFDRLIDENRLFRYSIQIDYANVPTDMDWLQSASLYQNLDSRQAVQYQVGIIGVHTPLHVRDYFVNFRYRRQLNRKWLFLEVTPEYRWAEVNSYEPHLAVLFKIEAIFRDD